MQISFGKIAGLIGALIPIGYIGYLLYYFMGVGGGSFDGVVGIGLGPTILGLAIVGLLFALPLIIKLVRAASGVNRVPGAGLAASLEPGALSSSETLNFDADAAFANYMRNRDNGGKATPVIEPISDDPPPFTPRPGSFGRKIV